MQQLEVPPLIKVQDRLTFLDMLYNIGTPYGHQTQTLKLKMCETQPISIEESYLVKRILRSFRSLKMLLIWKVCHDAMLQIVGVTCKHLSNIDIWKSVNATDSGVRMFLGLDAEIPFPVGSSLKKVAIKDTSITDMGAFNLMIHCENLENLEFSQDSFLQQLLWRISENYLRTKTMFNLRTLFLQVNKPCMMLNIVRSLPRLEELTVWTSLENVNDLVSDYMKNVDKLKLGGLNHSSFLEDMCFHIGSQLTSIKIETVHCDLDISLLGRGCPNIENLNVINARVKVTKVSDDHCEMFSSLKSLYFFLVQYLISPNSDHLTSPTSPATVLHPSTGHTALHP